MNHKYFKFFTNCVVSRGANRSLVIDIQRGHFIAIPDTLNDVILNFKNKKSIEEIKHEYGIDSHEIIDEYLEFLIEHEFGFIASLDEFDLFPDIDTSFEIPSDLSNCIVEISQLTKENFTLIINSLEKLFCKNVQFICYEIIEIDFLKEILVLSNNTNFKSIELVLHYSDELINFIKDIDKHNFRVTELVIHNSLNKNKNIEKTTFIVDFIDYRVNDFSHCGKVDKKYFYVNKEKVLESLNHNSCLNKKIAQQFLKALVT
jgi:SPASM domain peptide maturase of grasp-with-spasm system